MYAGHWSSVRRNLLVLAPLGRAVPCCRVVLGPTGLVGTDLYIQQTLRWRGVHFTHDSALCAVLNTASLPCYMDTVSLSLLAPLEPLLLLEEGERICIVGTCGGDWRAGDLHCARDLNLVGGVVPAVDGHGIREAGVNVVQFWKLPANPWCGVHWQVARALWRGRATPSPVVVPRSHVLWRACRGFPGPLPLPFLSTVGENGGVGGRGKCGGD